MACADCIDGLSDLLNACGDIRNLKSYINVVFDLLCERGCASQLTTTDLDPLANPGAATAEAFPVLPGCECGVLVLRDAVDRLYLSLNQGASWISVPSTKDNIAAIDPTVNDDSSADYAVGSRWINTADESEFVCVDATAGAAVWVQTSNVTPTPSALVEIASGKLVANAANIDITAIPQTYHDLVLVARLRCTVNNNAINMRFNGDAGANYAIQDGFTSGTTVSPLRQVSLISAQLIAVMTGTGDTAGYFNALEISLPGYYRNDITKVGTFRAGHFQSPTLLDYQHGSFGWENIANGINQITMTPVSGNFAVGTDWVLYGRGTAL